MDSVKAQSYVDRSQSLTKNVDNPLRDYPLWDYPLRDYPLSYGTIPSLWDYPLPIGLSPPYGTIPYRTIPYGTISSRTCTTETAACCSHLRLDPTWALPTDASRVDSERKYSINMVKVM